MEETTWKKKIQVENYEEMLISKHDVSHNYEHSDAFAMEQKIQLIRNKAKGFMKSPALDSVYSNEPIVEGMSFKKVINKSKTAINKSTNVIKKTANKSADVIKKTANKSADVIKKTANKSADVIKKTAIKSADVIKKTAIKSAKVISNTSKKKGNAIKGTVNVVKDESSKATMEVTNAIKQSEHEISSYNPAKMFADTRALIRYVISGKFKELIPKMEIDKVTGEIKKGVNEVTSEIAQDAVLIEHSVKKVLEYVKYGICIIASVLITLNIYNIISSIEMEKLFNKIDGIKYIVPLTAFLSKAGKAVDMIRDALKPYIGDKVTADPIKTETTGNYRATLFVTLYSMVLFALCKGALDPVYNMLTNSLDELTKLIKTAPLVSAAMPSLANEIKTTKAELTAITGAVTAMLKKTKIVENDLQHLSDKYNQIKGVSDIEKEEFDTAISKLMVASSVHPNDIRPLVALLIDDGKKSLKRLEESVVKVAKSVAIKPDPNTIATISIATIVGFILIVMDNPFPVPGIVALVAVFLYIGIAITAKSAIIILVAGIISFVLSLNVLFSPSITPFIWTNLFQITDHILNLSTDENGEKIRNDTPSSPLNKVMEWIAETLLSPNIIYVYLFMSGFAVYEYMKLNPKYRVETILTLIPIWAAVLLIIIFNIIRTKKGDVPDFSESVQSSLVIKNNLI
jgi:hypothetical protein